MKQYVMLHCLLGDLSLTVDILKDLKCTLMSKFVNAEYLWKNLLSNMEKKNFEICIGL